MDINDITGLILKKAFEVHSTLGPGLLESAYEECLFYEAFYPCHFLTIKIILFSKTNLNALCSLMTTPENHSRAVIRLPYPGTKCFGNSVL